MCIRDRVYTAPNSGTDTATFSLIGSVATDLAGNQNTAATDFDITYSDAAPTATITATDTTLKGGQTATVTIDWGETIDDANFDIADLSVNAGTLGNTLTETVTDREYTITYIATTTATGTVTLTIAAGSVTDSHGNDNNQLNNTVATYDTERPSVSITTDKANLKSGETATITVTFSEAVVGFNDGELTASGGLSLIHISEPTRPY